MNRRTGITESGTKTHLALGEPWHVEEIGFAGGGTAADDEFNQIMWFCTSGGSEACGYAALHAAGFDGAADACGRSGACDGVVSDGVANYVFTELPVDIATTGSSALSRFALRRTVITTGREVTERVVREAMEDAALQASQGSVNLSMIQEYVELALKAPAPAIRVDGSLIVEGHHRYIAARIVGQDVAVQPWTASLSSTPTDWTDVVVDITDWVQ